MPTRVGRRSWRLSSGGRRAGSARAIVGDMENFAVTLVVLVDRIAPAGQADCVGAAVDASYSWPLGQASSRTGSMGVGDSWPSIASPWRRATGSVDRMDNPGKTLTPIF
jgi:hypothetical protein